MSITLYLGCMYSGKTSALIRDYKRWKKIGKSVLCINSILDNRYGVTDDDTHMYSHDLDKAICVKTDRLSSIDHDILNGTDIIMINEGQFFPDIRIFCEEWCDRKRKEIIICGLDGDFEREPMGQITHLISICDTVEKFKALCGLCKDGTKAIFSWRVSGSKEKVQIGNEYIPVCRHHYNELEKKRNEYCSGEDVNM